MSILTILGDHGAFFTTIGTLGFLGAGGYLVWRLWLSPADPGQATTRVSAPPSSPAANRERAPSVVAGQQEYAQRGNAKTVKVSTPGTRPAPVVDPQIEALRKAERLGEIGFHHTSEPNRPPAGAPVLVPSPASETVSEPRTQTAELDDILSRIDKVLAENPVMATATSGAASQAAPAGAQPATGEADKPTAPLAKPASDEQQKLF